jgi:hypothetical protein
VSSCANVDVRMVPIYVHISSDYFMIVTRGLLAVLVTCWDGVVARIGGGGMAPVGPRATDAVDGYTA